MLFHAVDPQFMISFMQVVFYFYLKMGLLLFVISCE